MVFARYQSPELHVSIFGALSIFRQSSYPICRQNLGSCRISLNGLFSSSFACEYPLLRNSDEYSNIQNSSRIAYNEFGLGWSTVHLSLDTVRANEASNGHHFFRIRSRSGIKLCRNKAMAVGASASG